jgi:hypothetical protein
VFLLSGVAGLLSGACPEFCVSTIPGHAGSRPSNMIEN